MGDKGKRARWERRIRRERMKDNIYIYDNVHMYHPNTQLTR